MPAGTCVLLGSARAGTEVSLEMPFLQNGRTVHGVMQGESHPQEFIPRLVDHLMRGRNAGRPDDDVLSARGHQSGRAGFDRRHHDQARPADAGVVFRWQLAVAARDSPGRRAILRRAAGQSGPREDDS